MDLIIYPCCNVKGVSEFFVVSHGSIRIESCYLCGVGTVVTGKSVLEQKDCSLNRHAFGHLFLKMMDGFPNILRRNVLRPGDAYSGFCVISHGSISCEFGENGFVAMDVSPGIARFRIDSGVFDPGFEHHAKSGKLLFSQLIKHLV